MLLMKKSLWLPLFALSGLWLVSAAEEGWRSLFDGVSLQGWTARGGSAPGAGWKVTDGAIHRAGPGGDLLSTEEFLNFELEFEWKVSPKANSGIKYRVADYEPAGKGIGLEYQLLDDAGHSNGRVPKTSAGSIYDVLAPSPAKKLKPVGEWNHGKIVARGSHIEHWLNGEKILEVDLTSEEWKKALQQSKFKAAPDFGTKKGRLLLQDHGDEVWLRHLRVRPLPDA